MPEAPNGRLLFERQLPHDVFSWLDQVRQRPSMFIGDGDLGSLETLVWGYYIALGVHHVEEGVPAMTGHFSAWLQLRKRWSLSCGWARAIVDHSWKGAKPLDVFFSLVDDYRRLRPTVLCQVVLEPHHGPTGKRCVIGLDRLLPPPLRIEVVQYQPEPLHFLRFHYPDGPEDQNILLRPPRAELATSVDDARRWVEDEFQIGLREWTSAASVK